MKKTKRTKLSKQHNYTVEIILAIVGNTLGGIFTYFIINKMPKVFQEFYNKLLYYSITLNIVIVLTLLIIFFVITFSHTKKRTALMVFFIIIFFIVGLEGIGIYRMCKIKDKSLLLIAKFDDFSQVKVDIDGRIYEQLSSDKENNQNLRTLIMERIPIIIKNEEEAKREGVNGIWRNAKIVVVVWGKNDDIGGTTTFDVVKAPKKELITKIPIEKEISAIEEIRNSNFSYYKETLPDMVKFLSYFTFGLSSYSENNYTKALSYFNESINRFPSDGKIDKYLGDVHFYMGNCYYLNNDLAQAEKEYREAIKMNPDDIEAHNNLGGVLYDLKRYEEAEKECKEAIRINPNLAEAHNNLGILYEHFKRYKEAEKEYREVIRINPDYANVHNNLGTLLEDLKRYEEAEKEFREAIRINPGDDYAHYNLGLLLAQYLKRYDEAEKEFREAIRINPNLVEAHVNLGNLLRDLKRYEEAEKEYREAISIDPNLADVHVNLGVLLVQLQRYEEAEKELREAIRINPNYAPAHYNLGNLFFDLHRHNEAEKEFREAIRINPDYAEAHYNLGTVLLQKELLLAQNSYRFDEAEKEFREAIRINPNLAEAHRSLGLLLILEERKDEAKQEILKARKLFEEQEKVDDVKGCDEILEGL